MAPELAHAELIADRGDAAASEDFFRSRQFLAAEGVTHTLRIAADGGELLGPLTLRPIPGEAELQDAVSPYGYPGLAWVGDARAALNPAAIDFTDAPMVSAFIRHTLMPPPALEGARRRNTVFLSDPAAKRKSRPSDRAQVRKLAERGFETKLVPGPETDLEQRAGFLQAYTQTMERTAAAERYFFDAAYFDRVLSHPATWLALVISPEGQIAAGSVAALSDGMLHYYLSGTSGEFLRGSPMKSIVSVLTDLAEERGEPLNLGGGITPGDPLEKFKRGFANREMGWQTSELICDPAAYARLNERAGVAGDGDFFPAYRAPKTPG